jgi:hypothetical protein
MADQRPILPLRSGIGRVNPINVGGPGSAEEAFRNRQGLLQGILGSFGLSPAIDQQRQDHNILGTQSLTSGPESQVDIGAQEPPLRKGLGESILDAVKIKPEAQTAFGDLVDSIGSIVAPTDGFGNLPQRRILEEGMDGPSPEDLKGSLADQQAAAGRIREQFPNRSDDFIYGKGSENKGFKAGMDGPEPEDLTKNEVPGADNPAKKATVNALDEYLKSARPGVAPKDYAAYMKEFADATGLDISGQPDNSQALMAFGLALMQNKAGKGFDVGQILSATGAAGEKALPALEKARANAKAIRAKAGEYALGRTKEDRAAAMAREDFYIIPKGEIGGPLGVVEAITKGKGSFERLNSYELNNLDTNEEFNREYEIVKASDYAELAKEALKTPEVKDLYQGGSEMIALFDGAPKDIGLRVQLPDLNNPKARGMKPGIQGGAAESIQYVRDMEQDLQKQKEFFGGVAGLLNRTGTGAVEQTRSMIVQGLRNLGLDAGGETDPIKQIQVMLTELKAKNAAQILGESGKTLSDNDRAMVAEIVGGISFTEGDEALLVQKLGRLYDAVVGKAEQNLNQAYRTLDAYGVQYGKPKNDQGVRKGQDDEGEFIDVTSQ